MKQDLRKPEDLIGLSIEDAALADHTIRVMKRDGKPCAGTMDVKPNRINVTVENGIITEIRGLG